MRLADGTPAVAGVRVVAINASSRGNYLKDATGVISKINPGDPMVRWGDSAIELQTSRDNLKLARMSGNATLWDQTAVDVVTCAPDDTSGIGGRLVMKDSKCCVATLVTTRSTHPTKVWVVNVHLVHNNQGKRKKQLEKALEWLKARGATAPAVICGDFNACQRASEYTGTIQPLLKRYGFDPVEFDAAGGGASHPPATFPRDGRTLDYAFARNIGGTVTCLDNQGLSDHNGLRITLDGGLIVLCFNAHFGTDAHELAQPPIAYADFITRSGAAVVCMQECDWGQTTEAAARPVHQARSIREALEVGGRSWSGWLYAARKCGRTRMKNYARYRYLWQRGDVVWRDEVWSLGDV
tara:strand:- start:127 stop:1185 length:1059 start_codon:yes stop_codon:yes gene_type:complete